MQAAAVAGMTPGETAELNAGEQAGANTGEGGQNNESRSEWEEWDEIAVRIGQVKGAVFGQWDKVKIEDSQRRNAQRTEEEDDRAQIARESIRWLELSKL